jgi:signal transduction histidine kinase/response regulator of citrate/malate metabolism
MIQPHIQPVAVGLYTVSNIGRHLHLKKESKEIQEAVAALSQKIHYLESLISLLPGNIYWKSMDGTYAGCNNNMANLLGFSSTRDIQGKTLFDLTSEGVAKRIVQEERAVFEKGEVISLEEQGAAIHDGRMYLTEKAPILDQHGNIIGLVGNTTDITHLKKVEAQLKKSKQQAELANKLKSEFIQNMQHDIRTPISGIWSVLYGYMQNPDPKGLQAVLPLMVGAAEQLLNICNEVIDFENLACNDEQVLSQPVSLLDLANSVVELNSAAVIARQLYLKLDIANDVPTWIVSDAHRLKKIIINLVGNAIKFTQAGGVTLSITVIKKTKTKCNLQLVVEDTGIGIPNDKINQVFEKFSRLHPSDSQLYKGTGLGLFIVKKFVQTLRGKIAVESVESKGTRFIISLNVNVVADPGTGTTLRRQHIIGVDVHHSQVECEQAQISAPQLIQDGEPTNYLYPQVLIIEDDPLALFAAEQIWQQVAVKVNIDTAMDITTARHLLKNKTYDLVLSDLGLPDGNADALVQEIKCDLNHRNYHTPMVALTAHKDLHRHKLALEAGFNTVLCKPLMVARAQHLLDVYVTERTSPTEVQVEQGMDMNDVIDWDLCLNMANGRESLARELLDALVSTFPSEQKALIASFNGNDISATRAILHRFRGGLSYLGVPRLVAITEALQQQVRVTDNLVKTQPTLDALFAEMDMLKQAYQQLEAC